MIRNDGYIWAECDCCHLTLGVGWDSSWTECENTFRQWGWTTKDGKLFCEACTKDPGWIDREMMRIRRMKACSMNG